MDKSYAYDDVALVPEFFTGTSRSNIDTSCTLGRFKFKIPVVPANMKCVVDVAIASMLQQNDYFYVMHRFDVDALGFVEQCYQENWNYSSISLGVQRDDWQLVEKLESMKMYPDFITIDIAHGHSVLMRDMIWKVKRHLPKTFVIAGNVATPIAYENLCMWGADAVKVGVGPGKSCITRLKTGFYTPMFSTVQQVAALDLKPVIADGGVQHNGDIAKALVAGASMVMAGSIFAQCVDSPTLSINGEKVYYGSASAENKGHRKNVEGRKLLIESNNMTYLEKMDEITQDLQSAHSYAGGKLSRDTQYIVV
jgi:GMP reductase